MEVCSNLFKVLLFFDPRVCIGGPTLDSFRAVLSNKCHFGTCSSHSSSSLFQISKTNNSDNLEAQATWKEVYTSDLLSPDLAIADTLEATCPSVLISTCIVGLEDDSSLPRLIRPCFVVGRLWDTPEH